MRPLALFLIGLVFGIAGGFILAGGTQDMATAHDHMGHADDGTHDMAGLTEWPEGMDAPEIMLQLAPDIGADINLHMIADGFDFAPQEVNGPVTPARGHAHVYVNGVKVGRAYGPYMLLTALNTGDIVRVTLNANDHSTWGLNGQPISAEITVP